MPNIDSSGPKITLKELDRLSALAPLFPEINVECMLTSLLLIRTSHDLYNQSSSLLMERGLSQGKMRILTSLLIRKKPLLPSELAKSAGVTRSTMTGLINGLEKDGLIRRGAHEDRRMTAIHLTEEGEALLMATLPEYARVVTSVMSQLTEEEQGMLQQLLYKLRKGIEHPESS
ncbi:MarR family winged helix-turn-helix transcriptional regulator [Paenibacillus sp. Z6-24]